MTYANLTDFNSADLQGNIELIPTGTLAKAVLNIKPGGYGPEGWMTQNQTSGAVYLNGKFIILEGPYAKRRLYTLIGVKGATADEHDNDLWANMGRSMMRAILESARNIQPKDDSAQAQKARCIESMGDLNGLEFAVKIGIEHNKNGNHPNKNKIVAIVTPDHKDYGALMGRSSTSSSVLMNRSPAPLEEASIMTPPVPSWVDG
jgi:hypothetical protein